MSHRSPLWAAAAALVLGLTVSACGSSTATPAPAATPAAATVAPPAATPVATTVATAAATTAATAAPVATTATTTAAANCPSGATVGAALGITLPDPVGVKGGGGTQLPAGATGMACEYAGKGLNVIIEMISNIDPSSISLFSSKFPVPYASVSGVGDQARSFLAPLGGGKNNEGIVATKGSTLVDITATATPASLAQLEALVNQLL